MHKGKTLEITASILLVIGLSAGYYSHVLPVESLVSQNSQQPCVPSSGVILVVLDGRGFNESRVRGTPRPWIRVQRGETVDIMVCNMDPSQTHGFAIDHYFDVGVALAPGQVHRVHFVAKDPGDYIIYCDVFCPVHSSMIGRLTVSG